MRAVVHEGDATVWAGPDAMAGIATTADAAGGLGSATSAPVVVDVRAAFAQHGPQLLRIVERMCGNGAVAEDVVQETFLVLHRRRAELKQEVKPGDGLGGWLYRVAMNVLRHHRRSAGRTERAHGRLAAVPPDSAPSPDRRDDAERVRRALALLPEREREVLVLFEIEGLTGAEVGALVGAPIGTVWRRLHDARARFKRAIVEGT